jgi:hypothetical protein
MRSRSSLKSGPGWPACPDATSAGSTSLSACSPSTRFHLLRQQTRVTYWLAPGRRVILLTVFRKTRSAETAEVTRALRAQMICETQHSQAHDVFDREVN